VRITEVETILLSHSYPPSEEWRWNGGGIEGWNAAFVRVHTDQNISGVGEVYFGAFVPEMVPPFVEDLKQHLIGEDPFRVGYLWKKINHVTKFWNRHGFGKSVIAGIDLALYDIVGKATKLPVYQLLGGLCRPRIRAYASGGCSESLDVLLREVRRVRDAGFEGYKWRLIESSAAEEFMSALRNEAGPEFELMVDLVQGSSPNPWNHATVLTVARALEPFRPAWLEEPYPIEDKRGYRDLRSRVNYSISGGEGVSSLEEAHEFLLGEAVDILQPDVTIAGGLTLCQMIGTLAYANNVQIASHSWGAAGSLMGNLHFALANQSSTYMEVCSLASPFREALLNEPLKLENGCLEPPTGPGLGFELNGETIGRFPYKKSGGHSFSWEEVEHRRKVSKTD
jgi:L-alanine-DL-glutamate epimerase-like enolase superfamily enzyme